MRYVSLLVWCATLVASVKMQATPLSVNTVVLGEEGCGETLMTDSQHHTYRLLLPGSTANTSLCPTPRAKFDCSIHLKITKQGRYRDPSRQVCIDYSRVGVSGEYTKLIIASLSDDRDFADFYKLDIDKYGETVDTGEVVLTGSDVKKRSGVLCANEGRHLILRFQTRCTQPLNEAFTAWMYAYYQYNYIVYHLDGDCRHSWPFARYSNFKIRFYAWPERSNITEECQLAIDTRQYSGFRTSEVLLCLKRYRQVGSLCDLPGYDITFPNFLSSSGNDHVSCEDVFGSSLTWACQLRAVGRNPTVKVESDAGRFVPAKEDALLFELEIDMKLNISKVSTTTISVFEVNNFNNDDHIDEYVDESPGFSVISPKVLLPAAIGIAVMVFICYFKNKFNRRPAEEENQVNSIPAEVVPPRPRINYASAATTSAHTHSSREPNQWGGEGDGLIAPSSDTGRRLDSLIAENDRTGVDLPPNYVDVAVRLAPTQAATEGVERRWRPSAPPVSAEQGNGPSPAPPSYDELFGANA